jgi:spermidine/putrescine transport system permease protein
MAVLGETARPVTPEAGEASAARAEVRRKWLLCVPALVVLLFAASGPLLIVLVYSFLTPGDFGGVEWGFSTEGWFRVFFARDIFEPDQVRLNEAHAAIFWRSIRLAFQTTLICAILGFPTAWFIATRPERTRAVWLFLITIPFWTNLLIRTFAIQEVIRNEGLINTLLIRAGAIERPIQMLYTDFAILVGMAYVFLPLMVLPLYAAMDRLDRRLLEAAYDLYASRWQVLRRIVLPLVRPGLIAGSILVFIPAIGAYVTPRVLGGGRNMMLANLIELQFGQGRNWPLGAALALTLLVLVVAALVVYIRYTSADEDPRRA